MKDPLHEWYDRLIYLQEIKRDAINTSQGGDIQQNISFPVSAQLLDSCTGPE